MKFVILAVILLLIAGVGYQVYRLSIQKAAVSKEYGELQGKLSGIVSENKKLDKDVRFYNDKDNLEKEARSELNYRKPDEKEIIIVPKK